MSVEEHDDVVLSRRVCTIVADPPWLERGGGRIQRGADRHYSLLSAEASVELMQEWMSGYEIADNAHMYLWEDNGVSSIVKAAKRKHSQKPDEFYALVERRSAGGYLYMFSRSERDGWYMEGDEVGVL